MGPTIVERRGSRELPEQGHRSSDVLACPGEVWERFIVLDDPLVHVAGHGACASTVSMALDLLIKLYAFLLELESRFLDLSMSGF